MTDRLTIDCDACAMQHTSTCDDCLVTYLCPAEPNGAVVIDVVEVRALRLLSESGLVPALRHQRRTG
jgi:hypothetical protein